jgi:hypothetical protein
MIDDMARTSPPPRFHTTVTERGSFRDCRRRWFLESQERLAVKDQVQWPLIFGEAVHTSLEVYYRYKRNLKRAQAAFKKAWEEERTTLQTVYQNYYDMGIADEWVDLRDKGVAMLHNYAIFDKLHPFFDEITEINIEARAFVDILDKHREKIPGLPLLSGRIDLVGYKGTDAAPWIMDHKTAMSAPSIRALDIDDQLTGYCYIYWRLTGIVPRGAIYNVLSKEPPHPPKLLQSGKLSVDKTQRTTFELFFAAIKEHGLDVNDYEEFLNFLSEKGWRQFFLREGVTRNLEDLQSFEQHLFHEYKDIQTALQDLGFMYPNPSQRTCGWCSMIPLCQSMEEQGDVEYVRDNMYVTIPPRHSIPAAIASPKWKGV